MPNFVSKLGRPRKKNLPTFKKARVRSQEYSEPVQAGTPAEELSADTEETAIAEESAVPAEREEKEVTGMKEQDRAEPAVSAASVLHFFREVTAVPRGSGNTAAISDKLVQFAKKRGLFYRQDEVGNVLIRKEASEGAETAPGVVLQGHIDIVCEQEEGRGIDMMVTPPQILTEGDWLTADGTTLGADNGIAVAMMLALLDDQDAVHPPMECIFTVDEEVGMVGAQAMDLSDLQGRQMLNLDSETEGVFTAGCAGGAEVVCTFTGHRRTRKGMLLTVRAGGLLGGHSGDAIANGRANADIVLGRLLYSLFREYPFRLVSISGGNKDNAIPRNAQAQVLLSEDTDPVPVLAVLEEEAGHIRGEYALTDPGLNLNYMIQQEEQQELSCFSKRDTRRFLRFLVLTPNGVQEYDPSFPGLPQTSLNLGILRTEEDDMKAVFLMRSSLNSQRHWLEKKMSTLVRVLDGKIEKRGEYPAWEYRASSPFRDRLVETYRKMTGQAPVVAMIHGGLECGLLTSKVPGLDCVSMGPDMKDIHTPAEKLSISSTFRTWAFLKRALAELAEVKTPEETNGADQR